MKKKIDSENEDKMSSESEDEDLQAQRDDEKFDKRENGQHSLKRKMERKPIPDKTDPKKRKANSIKNNTPTSSTRHLEINENKNKLLTTIKLHASYTIRNVIMSKLYKNENEVNLIVEDDFRSFFKDDSVERNYNVQPCPMDFMVEKCERSSTTSDKIELFIFHRKY